MVSHLTKTVVYNLIFTVSTEKPLESSYDERIAIVRPWKKIQR